MKNLFKILALSTIFSISSCYKPEPEKIIDTTSPQINFNSPTPTNSSFSNSNSQTINFTIIDPNLDSIYLEFNGVNVTLTQNGNIFTYTNSTLTDGIYNYKVYVNDTASNINISKQRNFIVDTTSPQISFSNPTLINNSFIPNNNIYINVSLLEKNIDTITLNFNGVNETLNLFGNYPNQYSQINKVSLSDGVYNFKVYINDSLGNVNFTENRISTIDTTSPQIIYSTSNPQDGIIINNIGNGIEVTGADSQFNGDYSEFFGVLPTFSNGFNPFGLQSIIDTSKKIYKHKSEDIYIWARISSGYHISKVSDTSIWYWEGINPGQSFTNNPTNIQGYWSLANGNAPQVPNIISLNLDNTQTNQSFIFLSSDIVENDLNRTLLNFSGIQEEVVCYGISPNSICSINKTGLSDGTYQYNFLVYDRFLNFNKTNLRTLIVDTTQPQITFNLPTPINNSFLNSSSQIINFTINDSNIDTINLEVNGINVTLLQSENTFTYTNPLLIDGIYNYKVYVNDTASNSIISQNRSFTIDTTPPQISFINPTLINNSLSSDNFAFINISINELNINTIILEFNGTNQTLIPLGTFPNQYVEINKTSLSFATYNYTTYINDTSGNINKTDLRVINIVNSYFWNVFYGDLTGDLIIGKNTNIFYNFGDILSGNVILYNNNYSINFSELKPIGRKIDGTISSNDQQDLNNKIGHSQFVLKNLGSLIQLSNTENFILNKQTINNVPIADISQINSSGTSTFTTGILWDSSDDTGDLEFSGDEDFVFITKIKLSNGNFGTYDYESIIPNEYINYNGETQIKVEIR